MNKSPFLILQDFLSPLECEDILASIKVYEPNTDSEDTPIKTILRLPVVQNRIWNRFSGYFEHIEKYYNVEVDQMTAIDIEWYPEDCAQEGQRCENSVYRQNAWSIVNDYDLTVIIFLKDYNKNSDFDEEFECYGGELEMINHAFTINPSRGTAIIFPSNQYFINRTVTPEYGDMFQMRFHVSCVDRMKYSPSDYRGNYSTWFKGLT